MSANNDLRVDIRSALDHGISWLETVQHALHRLKDMADDRDARRTLQSISNLVEEADRELRELDRLVEELLETEVQLSTGVAVKALEFYADARLYIARRNAAAEVIADAGKIARDALAAIRGEDGEENGE